ncbi:MAG: recombinase family protein [Oscillospiraceae bacterium]|nr:recombinase family protein [Oscillospiraceae bacterium]
MPYSIYLRKSRSDSENETQEITLARHEKTLLELARKQNLNIVQIYREVASGDSIEARPEMQKLLHAVEQRMYDGVLVMDLDRLARGDSVDQGVIARSFKYSDTKIITPAKIYKPDDESDEVFFEFGLFLARQEYKTITRRMQRGRQISIQEGKFIGSIPPYGYNKVKLSNQKGYSLKINANEAENVRLIFDLYANEKTGTTLIAKKLNELDSQKIWLSTTVREILNNPVYIGNIRINSKPMKKVTENGKIKTSRTKNKNCVVVKGLHEPIISSELWEKAQKNIMGHKPVKVKSGYETKNPLAGLVYCGKCGKSMIRHVYRADEEQIICSTINCNNAACKLDVLERQIIKALEIWTENYKLKFPEISRTKFGQETETNAKTLNRIKSGLKELEKQSENIHDLLERGVYDVQTFLDRQKVIAEKTETLKKEQKECEKSINLQKEKSSNKNNLLPKIHKVMDIYPKLQTPKQKNELLKEVIEKVVYTREKGGRWINPEDFEIELYPKI